MKSITIHGLDEEMEKLINKRAKNANASVNKIVKELLRKALGLGPEKKDNRTEFLDFFGVWTEDEEKSFQEAIKDLETVNPEDWK
jgi:hypothetical protein